MTFAEFILGNPRYTKGDAVALAFPIGRQRYRVDFAIPQHIFDAMSEEARRNSVTYYDEKGNMEIVNLAPRLEEIPIEVRSAIVLKDALYDALLLQGEPPDYFQQKLFDMYVEIICRWKEDMDGR